VAAAEAAARSVVVLPTFNDSHGAEGATYCNKRNDFSPRICAITKTSPQFHLVVTDDSTNVARIYGSIGAGLVLSRYRDNKKGQETMADRAEEIRYLRRKARQFRELAGKYQTEISPKLYEIAVELERRADQLEQQTD
jgi:IMP cyclohydrolase